METIQIVLDSELLKADCRCGETAESESIGTGSPDAPGSPEAFARRGSRGARPARLLSSAAANRRVSSVGGAGGVAGRVNRGDIHLYRFARPDKQRAVLILTLDRAIAHLATATVAPITSTIRDDDSSVRSSSRPRRARADQSGSEEWASLPQRRTLRHGGRHPVHMTLSLAAQPHPSEKRSAAQTSCIRSLLKACDAPAQTLL